MADFTGFYYNNIHSSTYGILRVSNGDRYKESLLPDFEDREIQTIGRDGNLYQGTRYDKQEFSISIAFDHITENQLRGLKNWLKNEKLCSLQFDEKPYKIYWAKVSSPPELEYICFMEDKEDGLPGEKERIYKGEGIIDFIAYDPYGYCIDQSQKMTPTGLVRTSGDRLYNWQVSDTYFPYNINVDNYKEWGESAGLKDQDDFLLYNNFVLKEGTGDVSQNSYYAKIYNPGDFEVDFELFISFANSDNKDLLNSGTINMYIGSGSKYDTNVLENGTFQFSIQNLIRANTILLNTKNHSLAIYNNGKKNLRYDLVKSSHWVKIPKGDGWMKIVSPIPLDSIQIKYNYKYC